MAVLLFLSDALMKELTYPSVSHALILASSKNPREYIQRRGRVLRRAEGKSVAHIHDVLVLPSAVDDGRGRGKIRA